MPRIKLEEQAAYEFSYRVMLSPRDINYGGHLGNDSLVSLIGSARVHALHTMGLGEGNLGDGGTGVIMADLVVNYKAEAFLFDELKIDTHIGEILRSGFRFFHRVMNRGVLAALVETGMTTFDYERKRISPIPEVFKKKIEEMQKNKETTTFDAIL